MNEIIKEIEVEGMKCEGCAENVRSALAAVPHVSKVFVILDKHIAEITCDAGNPPSDAQLKEAVTNLGFDVLGIS